MKSWTSLTADKNMWLNRHYTPGRTQDIDKIVLHHNAARLTTAGCYQTWQTREASAHYQVEYDGTIGQLVHDGDTAWHASGANASGIGIEHANATFGPTWTISDATLENGAHLVAALCRYYKLGKPVWRKNVFPHKDFNATACPGAIAGSQRVKYMERAVYWYNKMGGTTTTKPTTTTATKLTITGKWDKPTTKALQKALGTTQDGIVSSQDSYRKGKYLTTGWEWVSTNNAVGSKLIMAMQKKMGITEDGLFGPATEKALKKHYKVLTFPAAIRAMQKKLNTKGTF